jgi:ribosomal protein S18 acetylase RimI-like enzyme
VGYVLYRLGEGDCQNFLYLDRLVVHESYRRRGCGSALVDKLIRKLGGRRDTLQTVARESDLGTLAFLQGMGFVAQTPVQRGYFEDTGEDGYVLVYQLGH